MRKEKTSLLYLHTYQRIVSTHFCFGTPLQSPCNLLEHAADLQIRVNRVVFRQLVFQAKNYALYDPDEHIQDKHIHLGYLMGVCQALARFCSASNTPLQECEAFRCTNFEQQKYTLSQVNLSIWQKLPSFSQEQSIWSPGVQSMVLHSTAIAHTSLLNMRHPQAPIPSFHEDLALLWTCVYERIESLGFQVDRCLERSQNGEFIEKTGYG